MCFGKKLESPPSPHTGTKILVPVSASIGNQIENLKSNTTQDNDPFDQGHEDSPYPGWEFNDEYVGDIAATQPGANDPDITQFENIDNKSFRYAGRDTWPRPSEEFNTHYRADAYNRVRLSGTSNEKGPRIKLKTNLNVRLWESEASGHRDDGVVISGIKFGFSMQYLGPPLEELPIETHASGACFLQHIYDYITEELRHGTFAGPFKNPPFKEWCRTSPLMTRPRSSSNKRRIKVDLSACGERLYI